MHQLQTMLHSEQQQRSQTHVFQLRADLRALKAHWILSSCWVKHYRREAMRSSEYKALPARAAAKAVPRLGSCQVHTGVRESSTLLDFKKWFFFSHKTYAQSAYDALSE